MLHDDVIREFLVESHENLSTLDQELVELEKHPKDAELLASIFRTVHTIKGTCGFFAFSNLERITHQAENLLSQLRAGQRNLNPALVSIILETVDAIRKILAAIEATGTEGPERFKDLTERLQQASQLTIGLESQPGPDPMPRPVVLADDQPAEEEASVKPVELESVRPVDHAKSTIAEANIRVGVTLLDKLMDLVGELVLARNQILQFNSEREDTVLNATAQRLNLVTSELQGGVMKTRMQPIGVVWNKLPRVVRDIAVSLGKQIRLVMEGEGTELDRTIIEAIKDPLVHLVRNSCDHGIETAESRVLKGKPAQGILTLRAYHEGGQVNIEIGDNGAGIDVQRVKQKAIEKGLIRADQAEKLSDREAVNLIFQPGFSTAAKITNVSGRGVGLDVVKSNIEKIGGVVDVINRPGEGATVKLKIPLTLAIIPGLVVTSGGERFVIPQVSLLELVRLEVDSREKQIESVHGTPVYRRRGKLLPVAYLNQVLGLPASDQNKAANMVVLQAEDRQFGLIVDDINDTQEIVVKPLGKQLKGIAVYAGATIMGDGKVALILDVLGIGHSSGVLSQEKMTQENMAQEKAVIENDQHRLLLFRSGTFERLAIPLSLVARLEEIPRTSVEHSGGRQVVQYRKNILPLATLRTFLEPGLQLDDEADPLQVLVFDNGGRSVGIVVDQILDVSAESVTAHRKTRRKGLLGSAVVGKQVVDFLDLEEVIRSTSEDCSEEGRSNGKNILIAEASAFSRGLIRHSLDMAGYRVFEAGNQDEVIRRMEQHPIDLVVTALGSAGLLASMRACAKWQNIPVVALAESMAQVTQNAATMEFEDCLLKADRQAMLESIARLSTALASSEPVLVGEEI